MDIPIISGYPELPYRNHLSRVEIFTIEDVEYEQEEWFIKPSGFWYALGDGWLKFNNIAYPDIESNYLYGLTLDDIFVSINDPPDINKILVINSLEELLHLELLYNINPYNSIRVYWKHIITLYGGIEFRYDCFSSDEKRKLQHSQWYDTLDATSGCIWSYEILRKANLTLIIKGQPRIDDDDSKNQNNRVRKSKSSSNNNRKAIEWRFDPDSYIPNYLDMEKSKISKSKSIQRIMLLSADDKPLKLKNDINAMLLRLSDDIDCIEYEYYEGDVSLLEPIEGYRIKLLKISKKYFTDIYHPNKDKILKITSRADLIQLNVAYQDYSGDKILYDRKRLNFEVLSMHFGGIDVDMSHDLPNENVFLNIRTAEYLVNPGGIVWNPTLSKLVSS